MVTEQQIADFAKACQAMREAYHAKVGDTVNSAHIGYSIGKRYARLTSPNGSNPDGSCWAFVDMHTGDVFKPAGWSKPAKHARGNIAKGVEGMGPHGPAYLR
jgi:hypothetical protein